MNIVLLDPERVCPKAEIQVTLIQVHKGSRLVLPFFKN